MKSKIFFYLMICYLIKSILGELKVLSKYMQIEATDENFILFESSSFSIDDEIYFEFRSEGDNAQCNDIINYDFYDTQEAANTNITPSNSIKKETSKSVTVNGVKTSETLYFTIEKKTTNLNGTNGDFLLINFDCTGNLIIENTETNNATIIIVVVIIAFILIFGIIIAIIVCCCCCVKKTVQNASIVKPAPLVVSGFAPGPYAMPQPVIPQMGMGGAYVYNNSNIQSNIPYTNVNVQRNMAIQGDLSVRAPQNQYVTPKY